MPKQLSQNGLYRIFCYWDVPAVAEDIECLRLSGSKQCVYVYVLELQVLRKFLDVFSSFDWDSMALSLQGPIPLSAFDDPEGMLWVLEPS